MPRLLVRRATPRPALTGPSLLGLAVGVVAGFIASELWGPTAHQVLQRRRQPQRPSRSMAGLVNDAQAAIAADRELRVLPIDVLPVSRQRVELHGWVPARVLRTRAYRLACEAVGSDAVINCLLVSGEDDDTGSLSLESVSA